MAEPKVLVIVLAGGEGKRMLPLTEARAKPAVPFGGSYRIIDFALSNFANSRYLKIVVLTQYKSQPLVPKYPVSFSAAKSRLLLKYNERILS